MNHSDHECSAEDDAFTLVAVTTAISPENLTEWYASTRLATNLNDLADHEHQIVIERIARKTASPTPSESRQTRSADQALSRPEIADRLKSIFTMPPIDRDHLHCEPCMRAENEQLIHVAIGAISPLTKLKWLGFGFITEGRFLGEGKDAIVHAAKGNPEWVIKELKFGGADRAQMLAFYTNQLAADARLMVPELTHLGDGRLLQPFVRGEPIANAQFLMESLAAQTEAMRIAHLAKEVLGIKAGEAFIQHGQYKVGVDPSFANFLFDAEHKLSGWIDPLYSFSSKAGEHSR